MGILSNKGDLGGTPTASITLQSRSGYRYCDQLVMSSMGMGPISVETHAMRIGRTKIESALSTSLLRGLVMKGMKITEQDLCYGPAIAL